MRLTREALVARACMRDAIEPLSRREWWRGAALYQIYVRSFNDASADGVGDLKGIIDRLDYIAGLNVDGFWLSPIHPSPQRDFGYDITDFRAIEPIHGTIGDFDRLVEAAHDRGLKVLMDLIPCHTSDEHPWFLDSRANPDGPHGDWYVWADPARDGGPPNNWLSSFGGPAWTWEPRRSQYYYHPFLFCQPALNLLNEAVLTAICDVMRHWLDRGVDGFRVDAVQCLGYDPDLRSNPPQSSQGPVAPFGGGPHNPFVQQSHIYDRDVPEAFPVIERMRCVVDDYAPERVLIGELADVDSARLSDKYTVDGLGFHAVYDFSLVNVPSEVAPLTDILNYRSAFLRTGWLMNVLSNHDSKRAVSDLTGFADAAGKRVEAQKMLLFMQFALKGGGIIYQGEELALPQPALDFEDLRDPWGIAFWPDFEGRDGARTPMPWSATHPHCGFTDADEPWSRVAEVHRPLAVDQQTADPESCLSFLRALLAWRRDQPLLRWGGEHVCPAEYTPLIVWERYGGGRSLLCVVNFSLEPQRLPQEVIGNAAPVSVPGLTTSMGPQGLELPPFGFAALDRGNAC